MVCKMSGFVQGVSVSASVFTLVAIAVERFVHGVLKTLATVTSLIFIKKKWDSDSTVLILTLLYIAEEAWAIF